MKKIMFNDLFGLTDAVLNVTKTVTRRICDKPPYKVGEVVAIAQRYEDIICGARFYYHEIVELQKHAGYKNKMFVEVDLMPHHIEILDVRVELLQDIYKDGKLIYNKPSLAEIGKHADESKNAFYPEYRRVVNTQKYKVDLSDSMFELKNNLLHNMG